MSEHAALAPCPFCKNAVHIHTGHQGIRFITCGQRDDGSDGCGAIVSFRPDLRGDALRRAWDRREAEEELREMEVDYELLKDNYETLIDELARRDVNLPGEDHE